MASWARSIVLLLPLAGLLCAAGAGAATLPSGFSESLIASGLTSPTAMQFAPDGRLFVCEQTGRVRVIKNGQLLSTPFLTLSVDSSGERGLLGIAFDPSFASNGYVYVYYTMTTTPRRNRISRFTANGDVAAGPEDVVMDLDPLSSATNHNGGALNFGADGRLYVAVGENANGSNAQTLANRHGKMLRINTDGSIPADNPFYNEAQDANRAIWALGLRNPFTFAFNRSGTQMLINDVGQNTWEEINDGIRGANYGWPDTEGPTTAPGFVSPRYAYTHASGGCAITGGAFYTPLNVLFPAEYENDYFFADFCGGWIKRLDLASDTATSFATGVSAPVDLKVTDAGHLYYLARGSGGASGIVYRITYDAAPVPPSITTHPSNQTAAVGGSATFTVVAAGTPPLEYQWQRDGTDIPGATASSYTINDATLQDDGATFRVRVTNSSPENALSDSATLTVSTTANTPPTATITQPAPGTLYSGGSVISYAGAGTDPQDGTLPASAFTWRIDFHHDTHTHPFVPTTSGATGGVMAIPTAGETSANVWYRIYLTVRDSGGLTHTVQRDVFPRKVRLTLDTVPQGLQVRLDGQPMTTPLSFDAVAGITRNLGAQEPQVVDGTTYELVSWSDGGAPAHDVITPSANARYTATYRAVATGPGAPPPPALSAFTNGLSLSVWWTPVAGATSYRLEAGTTPNNADLVDADVGLATALDQIAPPGTYYARIRSVGPGGIGGPSNEVRIDLDGAGPCVTPPPAPAGYRALVDGSHVALSWGRSPSATSYVLEAGSASGLANLFNANVGSVLSISATAPAGRYFTRLRAVNACGSSAPSPEVQIALGCAGPPPASTLAISNVGGIITLSWTTSPGATTYGAQVGTASGLGNVFTGNLGSITSLTVDARGVAGTFFVRVFAANACGATAASNEVSITLP